MEGELRKEPDIPLSDNSNSSMEVDEPSNDEDESVDEEENIADDEEENSGDEDDETEEVDEKDEDDVSAFEEEEENEQTRFFETYEEEDSLHHQTAKVLFVGGSNVPNIQLESDEDLKVDPVALWEGGIEIIQGDNKVRELSPEDRANLDIIALHLGTCNFPCKGDSSVMTHYFAYMDMAKRISMLCPNVHIIMSGLLPQSGKGREIANEQIQRFNDALRSVGEDKNEPNLHFCENWSHFVSEGHVIDELYRDPHTLGVHVNEPGGVLLGKSIMQCIKKVVYWERLGVPLESTS